MIEKMCQLFILNFLKWTTLWMLLGQNQDILVVRAELNQRPLVRLKDILRPDYDSFQTPRNEGEPASVCIQIEILNIRSVNVVEMSYIADVFLTKTWRDTRLMYPANRSIEKVALNPEWMNHLWTPDIYFHNAIEGVVQQTIIPYVYVWLKNDSTIIYGARLSLRFSCDMMLHDFPHDTQNCDIIIKSLTHTLNEMNIHWSHEDPLTVGDLIILPQFEYYIMKVEDCSNTHERRKHGQFGCLRGVIRLVRRAGYYAINIYIPTILIVFMSMLTFWIPPDAVPGRITLGVTSLLTIITKQYQASLPNVSYVVALNVWLSCCIGFVFLSLLEYAVVIALLVHQKRKEAEKIEDRDNNVNTKSTETPEGCWTKATENLANWVENIDHRKIDKNSRIVFPALFVLQGIIYWLYYCL